VVREIPIPTPHADERLVPTTLKPCEEVNNGRVITLTRTVVEAGRDDCRVSKAARDTRGNDTEIFLTVFKTGFLSELALHSKIASPNHPLL
jgi:hypothetical protein